MLDSAYVIDSRIHNASWGTGANTYDSLTKKFDSYVHSKQDMLLVFAAGNVDPGDYSYNTAVSPSVGKNVISGTCYVIRSISLKMILHACVQC